ncbi:MAG: B12-binding domain-containing radical SAM protein, partial [Spirochaetales bacterium]|nr:B12-binding domain-containing radical SAM protein [Spirochaetales bacterium]
LSREQVEWADMVFLSAMLVQQNSFNEVVALCRECGTTVVAGGPYPTSSFDRIEGVDHFVLDEAECTLPEFLRDLEEGNARPIYRAEGRPDLARTPLPRFDLIDVKLYESMPLQFSRGCPFDCEFCDIIELFGRKPRTKSAEQFLREVDHLYDTGFRGSLFIVDDNFLSNKHRVKELLPPLAAWQKEHRYPFSLSTEASITLAQDEELLDLMVKAGFTMVFVGIETPDAETLARNHKTQNLREDILSSIARIQKRGIEVSGGFIVGFDGEREDIFERQKVFIQKAGIPTAMVGLLMALPNTRLYRRLKQEGRLLGETHGNNTHDFDLNFVPQMPKDRLIRGYKWLLDQVYSPRCYFQRSLIMIRRFAAGRRERNAAAGGKDPVRIRRSIRPRDVAALLRSLFRQGFSSYGLHYIRYLVRVLAADASFFPHAVTVAVRGHHFIRITREILRADAFRAMVQETLAVLRREIEFFGSAQGKVRREELEARIRPIVLSVRRTYGGLSRGVQSIVADAFAEFEHRCQVLLQPFRVSHG